MEESEEEEREDDPEERETERGTGGVGSRGVGAATLGRRNVAPDAVVRGGILGRGLTERERPRVFSSFSAAGVFRLAMLTVFLVDI